MQPFDVKQPNRPTRDSAVEDQYEGAAAAAGYAAAHDGWGATARFFHSRLHAVLAAIAECPGGELIDVGCGPGMLVQRLLDTRPADFKITACDLSPAMVAAAAARAGDAGVHTMVARIEDLPVPDGGFDVVLAMGVLEYADADQGLRELARIVRPNGLVLVTMLNPRSIYRLFEWSIWWPALRLLGRLEKLVGVPVAKRHGAPITGIRAYSRRALCGKLRDLGLRPEDVVYFDLTPVPPPFDRVVRKFSRRWRAHPERTATRGLRRWMGTAYLVTARRTP
ncbi:MAG TPA: class I SAM-dependent methyltransferase [Actinophytocola sp.]|uniref:class I SAM-dependent methyltransferase n=1 Tax=Actinophytocola sp. TaxID=1872138 RepID=UPI002DBB4F2C|nr:class I SAM-dependent methyltransferase [Actinophytocola sp.]HEU5472426.1 class I SAM-dependent methyltransferase [Actinophytocola sp.]